MSNCNKFFMVTSFGRTGTYWLANALNSHTEVLCGHAGVLPPLLDYPPQPTNEHTLYAHKTQDEFVRKSLDEVCEELEKAGNARAYGLVHAYAVQHLFTRPQLMNARQDIAIVNIVRHPVTRIESLKARLVYEVEHSPYTKKMLQEAFYSFVPSDVIELCSSELNLDVEQVETRAFIYATCFTPLIDAGDLLYPVPHVPMERITKDVESFTWLFSQLTQGAVRLDVDYLDKVFKTKRMNYHVGETSALGRYETWLPWMRTVFNYVMGKYDFLKMYGQFDYDFSFAELNAPPVLYSKILKESGKSAE